MSSNPFLISIVVPVYNVEKYIGECIDSILAQTFRDFELLLIDDGSSDESGRICDEYARKNNRVKVYHKENGGVSSARNCGIEQARGQWICFVDSDDTIDPTYLDDFGTGREADLFVQGYKRVVDGVSIREYNFSECKYTGYPDILSYMEDNYIINSPCFKLYKREIIDNNKIRFDSKYSYGEDHLFSLEYMLYVNRIAYTHAAGYNYRNDGQSSLTNRVVPYKNIAHYSVDAFALSRKILARNYSLKLSQSFVNTYLENFIRTLRSIFNSNGGLTDFSWAVETFDLSDITVKLKKKTYKKYLALLVIRCVPASLSFHFFKILFRASR